MKPSNDGIMGRGAFGRDADGVRGNIPPKPDTAWETALSSLCWLVSALTKPSVSKEGVSICRSCGICASKDGNGGLLDSSNTAWSQVEVAASVSESVSCSPSFESAPLSRGTVSDPRLVDAIGDEKDVMELVEVPEASSLVDCR